MLHFVTSYMKQNKSRKQTLESAQYGLEISFKILSELQTTLTRAFFPKLFSMSTPKFLQICFSFTFPNFDTSLNDFKLVVRRKPSSLAAILVFLT